MPERGQLLREGLRVAIVGRPNVGNPACSIGSAAVSARS